MKKLGLIGNPLTHSFSEKYFAEKFVKMGTQDWVYKLFPLPTIDKLPSLLASEPDLVGLNITIPYKQQALKYIHELDNEAAKIGAINTISIGQDGRLKGSNTDVIGFENTLVPFIGKQIEGIRALILGSGGAAKAIQYVLAKNDIPYTVVSRKASRGVQYEDVDETMLQDNRLIINCTPVGTYPNEEQSPPIPYEYLGAKHFLYDLVYNPKKTLFLQQGSQRGAKTINGYGMLEMQAEAAWEIWNKS